jgi:transcriptional regulator
MYIPKSYKNENLSEVKQFIQSNSFGILVSQNNGKSIATHIPLELSKNKLGKDIIQGHVAKANSHWHLFKNNSEVLAIFTGPHGYISSSWYDFEEVPTWNYIAVHVYGVIKIIEGEELYNSLKQLVDKYESTSKNPIKIEELSKKTMRQIHGIVGFEIEITDIQAAYKLSQTYNDKNHQNIISELESSKKLSDKNIADAMKTEREKSRNGK